MFGSNGIGSLGFLVVIEHVAAQSLRFILGRVQVEPVHRLSEEGPLDFVVLFLGVSAVLGLLVAF